MRTVKSRNWSNQEDGNLALIMDELQRNQKKMTWNEIAGLMAERNPDCNKTGKQCRERWTNQINPSVKRSEGWSAEENQILFQLHEQLGNRWSEISERLPGRTDNCIKNHFYSVMRSGFRKINLYIEKVKRKQVLVKTFKNQILTKILAICEGKNNQKYQLYQNAQQISLGIKKDLVAISLDSEPDNPQTLSLKQKVYNDICEFARKCRKKKSKRVEQSGTSSQDQSVQVRKASKKLPSHKTEIACPSQPSCAEQHDCQAQEVQANPAHAEQAEQIDLGQTHQLQKSNAIRNSSFLMEMDKSARLSLNLQQQRGQNQFSSYFAHGSNSNYFNMGHVNVEGSQDWARNSGMVEPRHFTGFINTVPDVTNKKAEPESELRKGEFDFTNFNLCMMPELETLFRKDLCSLPLSDITKSYELEKSFSFSSGIKESPFFFQMIPDTPKLGLEPQAMFSSSSFSSASPFSLAPMQNSSGFSLYSSSGLGRQSQEIKLRSTKCEEENPEVPQPSRQQ